MKENKGALCALSFCLLQGNEGALCAEAQGIGVRVCGAYGKGFLAMLRIVTIRGNGRYPCAARGKWGYGLITLPVRLCLTH